MRAATRTLTRNYDEALKDLGLKITQYSLLCVIIATKPGSVTQLADAMVMDRTALIRNLNVLVKNGWVEMGEEGYRREREIRITDKGKDLIEKAWPLWEAVQTKFENQTGIDKWNEYRDWLKMIAKDSNRGIAEKS